ncbi:hypothetical protein REPUB_Repub04eG0098400 [Reevesia pubescens]
MASSHNSESLHCRPEIQAAICGSQFLVEKNGRSILQVLTGFARPGELLAKMGPSGCGKSTLLDAVAGRLGPHTRQVGDILINGQKQTMAYGTSAYVTQDDTLINTLIVREAVYYSAKLQLPGTMSKSEEEERAEKDDQRNGIARC